MHQQQRTPAAHPVGFAAFYPAYLADHTRPATRAWHVAGTLALLGALASAPFVGSAWPIPAGVVLAYACAWLSHLLLERNRPATFRRPIYSVLADFRMTYELLTGRRPWDERGPTPGTGS